MTTEPAFIHPNTRFVSQRLPNWLAALDEPAINAMGASLLSEQYTGASTQADWFTRASADQQQALLASQQARATARLALAEVFKDFQGVLAFAEPRLKAHLKQQMNQDLDVHGTVLAHVVEHTSWLGLQRRYTPVNRTLLMAALHNFNADQAFGINSGVAERGSVAVDYVPRAEADLQRPLNSDGSTLDANELAPIDDDYPLLRFQRGKTLAIRPQDFARECRTLDLGGQYQRYLHDRLLSPVNKTRVRDALMAARQAELRCLRQVALLTGDIDAATFAMIGQLLDDQPLTLAGQPMQAVTLEMLYAVPHEVVLFVPTSSADPQQPCIAWIAGDSHAPLCQYRHRGAFMASLVTRLRVPAYCNEFMDRISLAERQDFHARLTAQLALDTPAMMANTRAMGAQVLAHLHARHIGWLQSQALCVAISTEQVDRLATLDRWLGLLDTGVNLLNLAAMFIPALGPVMLPIITAQAMNELYHGLADLADHQVEAAWSHLGGLALNIVLGVVAHQSLKAYGSVDPFVDDLLQVQMPDGQPRLWHADITAYAADLALDPAWRADAQGLYDVQGSHYVALDGKLYLTRVDALSAERVIVRPDGPAGFAPALRSNGRGSWLHQGEQPLTWPRNRLLRRLSPAASGLSDAAMEHVLDIAGIDEAVVRQAVSDLVPAPLELTDTLARLGDAQQLERLIASVRRGERWAEAWPMPVEQWVEHPRWPPSLVLEVFEGAEPWGVSTVYGDRAQAGARWVAVVRADLASADRMGQVLDAIGERACDELTGGPAASGRAARVESLQQVFADHLHSRRAVVFQQATHLSAMPLPAQAAALPRDFPSLDGAQVRTLLEGATGEELERLSAGRVPLRMAEEARVLLRTRRINRAIAGLYQPALANADSEKLRTVWGHAPASVLVDREQAAALLGIKIPARPGFHSPVRVGQRIGYPLSGRGATQGFTDKLVFEVRLLFPTLDLVEIEQLVQDMNLAEGGVRKWLSERLQEQQAQRKRLDQWVAAGDKQYGRGTANAQNRRSVREAIKHALRRVSARVTTHDGQRIGFELDLSGLRLDDLPDLSADFSHVKSLRLNLTDLAQAPEAFLSNFHALRHLDMSNNRLTALPEALAHMKGLTRLRMANNRIVWGPACARVLEQLTSLRELRLSFNPLGTAPEVGHLQHLHGIVLNHAQLQHYPQSVLSLPALEVLDLRNNAIVALPAAVLEPGGDNAAIVERINRDTHLEGNPLSAETLAALRTHRRVYGNAFGVGPLLDGVVSTPGSEGAVRWLQQLAAGRRDGLLVSWNALQAEPGSQAFFDVIEQLRNARDFQTAAAYPELRERVWNMVEAASEHSQLREELFDAAAHDMTCSDGATLMFSQLQVRTLVFQASGAAAGPARQASLLALAKGLFRLDEVEKAAFANVASRPAGVDIAEVQLIYRTRLATVLELPGQPRGMRFAPTAGVSEQRLKATEQTILAMEGSQAMIESVASRDFWINHLRQDPANRARFDAHDATYYNLLAALEADGASGAFNSAAYARKLEQLTTRRRAAERRLVMALTQAVFRAEVEVTEL